MNKKSFGKLLVAVAFSAVLMSCSSDIVNYPSNADDNIVTVTGDTNGQVTDNQYSDVYANIASNGSPSAKTLDNILYNMSTDTYLTGDFAISDTEFQKRYQKEMLDAAKGGTYSTDNEFDEYRYALTLKESMYDIKTKDGKSDLESIKAACVKQVINPDLKDADQSEKWDSVFHLDYSDYINRYYKPTIYRQYLTAWYIYNNNYSAIGNTAARNVTVVEITDRTDKPGEAIKLITAWLNKTVGDSTASVDDCDLHNLARLWKGVDVTTDEQNWLNSIGVSNLSSKIDEEVAKITDKNQYTTDSDLESSYTGSYTYPVSHGVELAKRELEVKDLITEGTFLKSNSVGNVPTTLKNNIFSSNISTDTDSIKNGTKKDVTYISTHGDADLRYIAPSTSISGSSSLVDKMVTYDSSTKSYFIVQLNSVVTTSRISQSDSDTDTVKTEKRTLAMNAAYEMASSDTYKKTAIVYFLTSNTISYSDPDFYSYIKTNYPDAISD